MRYTVEFRDGSTEEVSVDVSKAQSEDHAYEMITLASSDPDEVDDWWLTEVGS